MKKITTNKKLILESVSKMVVGKDVVSLFLKGKISKTTLNEKEIILTNPCNYF